MGHSPVWAFFSPIIEINRYIGVRMSRDQKPGKVRVVSGSMPVTPMRRAADRAALAALETADSQAPVAPAAPLPRGTGLLLPSLLFVLGCAIGGAAFTALGLF
jgi:hypothetical protein